MQKSARLDSQIGNVPTTQKEAEMITRSLFSFRKHLLARTAGLMFLAVSAFVTPLPAHAQSTFVVDDDGQGTATNCNAGAPAFSSIQAAVNAAASGDTIFICPGTYNEQVVVTTSNLTIRGVSAGSTVLRPTVVVQNTFRLNNNRPAAPILLIDGVGGVTVTNLTIDGSLADSGTGIFSCGRVPVYSGIYYRNSSGSVDTTHVTNIKSATSCTFAILVETNQSGVGGVANVVVTNSLVDRYGVAGIICTGQNTACTATWNTIMGDGPVSDLAQIGIVIRAEAGSAISGNVITNHVLIPGHGLPAQGVWESAVGIMLLFAHPGSNPHLLRDNIFANNQVNVLRLATGAAYD